MTEQGDAKHNAAFLVALKVSNLKVGSQVAQGERICQPMQEMRVWSLGWEDLLEKEMTTHFSILAWKIPWTEEPGRLWSPWTIRAPVGYKSSWDHKELDMTETEHSRFVIAFLPRSKCLNLMVIVT